MAVRDPEDSRRRILAAATAEFANYGIAGARMDRVAERAASSKERIYAYFGNKDRLFDIVFTASAQQTLESVRFDAADLPGYAGRMFDYFAEHPHAQRLTMWYRLERPHGPGLAVVHAANHDRLAALAAAQAEGRLSPDFTPAELLTLIQSMAASWNSLNPEFAASAEMGGQPDRRTAVVRAVARLV
ncbi:hypothetical protein Aab01nite_63490 [Paractinoplanes abujensis]|uniref:AcrR family transcriptional regulator n=1 Tax=Paractinoplanes abujensis TaxID=882441 RepID=A0A7W7CQ98_9ACTN|nr:TetR family transcriptional regulator [Actinoplanes abujensis]MBB4692742.1 AcrR family transcriptional regulator [Actinoplanes abujensis]GID22759.1 hypothetical protein Aab01nite_63490 [Actinoplanes abujensis]